MDQAAVALAAISLAGAISAGMFKQLSENRKAQDRQTEAQKKTTDALKALVAETKRGNDASERRNGHLGELIIQQTEQTKEIAAGTADHIITAVSNVKHQHVQKQTVNEEVVRHEVVNSKETNK